MSRARSIAGVGLAAVAMWLVLAWPHDQQQEEQDDSPPEEVATVPPAATIEQAPPMPAASPTQPEAQAAPVEPDSPPPAPAKQTGPVGDILEGDRGPVEEYQRLYDSQARDSEASDVEAAIRAAFSHSDTPDLMRSVSCHESICKVLIGWSPDRANDYIKATRWLALGKAWPPGQTGFDIHVAITSASGTDRDGARLVELYLKRKPRGEELPSHPH